MLRRLSAIAVGVALALSVEIGFLHGQEPDARQIAQERAQAELDAPKLVEALGLRPGMTVADIGAGGGAMTVVLGKWIGPGHVFSTDITEPALRLTREYARKEGLSNVTVIEGGAATTNLPPECCDAAFLRHVYHHITAIDGFNQSLFASLKPGGRLALIDFTPQKGSELPRGVPANRGGHGVPPQLVIEEMLKAGFRHVRTIDSWPPGDKRPVYFLTLFQK